MKTFPAKFFLDPPGATWVGMHLKTILVDKSCFRKPNAISDANASTLLAGAVGPVPLCFLFFATPLLIRAAVLDVDDGVCDL